MRSGILSPGGNVRVDTMSTCGLASTSAPVVRAPCWWTSAAVSAPDSPRFTKTCRWSSPLWAEQRPENWWDAVVEAIRGVLAKAGVSGADVKGIGLSGQMHGLVILDEAHEVIRPSLIWCDQRSQAQVDFVNAKIGREKVLRYTANPVLTGLHAAQTAVGARSRAGEFRARAQDAAAQGLRALPADRRVRHRSVGRLAAPACSTW